MRVELIAVTVPVDGSTQEELIERAGRVCHKSESRGNPSAFVKGIMNMGHTSVVEHVAFTFEISGISRACGNQLVRHRIGCSFSQESTRYVDMSDPDLVVPPSIANNKDAFALYKHFQTYVSNLYVKMRALGVPKEDARSVLPLATTTKIVVTMNCRALLNFFDQRLDPAAQWEIREMAGMMLDLVLPYAPVVFNEFKEGET